MKKAECKECVHGYTDAGRGDEWFCINPAPCIKEARNAALEEAAKIAEKCARDMWMNGTLTFAEIAKLIRQLKENG